MARQGELVAVLVSDLS